VSTAGVTFKEPALRREFVFDDFVIVDFEDMARAGGYERGVLLWWQERYTQQTLIERAAILDERCASFLVDGPVPERLRSDLRTALIEEVRLVYAAEKHRGGGADLRGYLDAARAFLESAAERCDGHLAELVELLQLALAGGGFPNLDQLGRSLYLCLAKWSGIGERLGELNASAAERIGVQMSARIAEIAAVTSPHWPEAGRAVLQAVGEVAAAPDQYIEFSDPERLAIPARGPWDYEPDARGDGPGW